MFHRGRICRALERKKLHLDHFFCSYRTRRPVRESPRPRAVPSVARRPPPPRLLRLMMRCRCPSLLGSRSVTMLVFNAVKDDVYFTCMCASYAHRKRILSASYAHLKRFICAFSAHLNRNQHVFVRFSLCMCLHSFFACSVHVLLFCFLGASLHR